MVLITKTEQLEHRERTKPLLPLLDSLINCTDAEFVQRIQQLTDWQRPKEDLHHWIPVLNRLDSVLEKYVKKFNLTEGPTLKLIDNVSEELLPVLKFSFTLLNHSTRRSVYASVHYVKDLINCPNIEVRLACMKILALLGERFAVSGASVGGSGKIFDSKTKSNALKFGLLLPSSSATEDVDHFTLNQLFDPSKSYPPKWEMLDYPFYSSRKELKHFIIKDQHMKTLSLQEIFNRAQNEVQRDKWFEFSIKATVAHAFSTRNQQMIHELLMLKFAAVSFIVSVSSSVHISSKLFEVDPYIFNSLCDFTAITTEVPNIVRLEALNALECISLKSIWCSDIVKNLGGNMSHGLLFQILRHITAQLAKDDPSIDEEYNVHFFFLISNLISTKNLHQLLLSAGLIPHLLQIISTRTKYRRTLASCTHLLEMCVQENLPELVAHNGFQILIDTITYEVDFALNKPDYGNPPAYTLVYYSVTFGQVSFLRALIKFVVKIITSESGDRIRNLIDSPLLLALNKILDNKFVFGYTLLTLTLDLFQSIINSEPISYPILVESGTVPYILQNFENFFGPSAELIAVLVEVISAICLNTAGLQEVQDRKLLDMFFEKVFFSVEYARLLMWADNSSNLGSAMDEISRHYPILKPIIKDNLKKIFDKLECHRDGPMLYLSEKYGSIYRSKEDEVIDNEEGSEEIIAWEVQDEAFLLENFLGAFDFMLQSNLSWMEVMRDVSIEKFLSLVVVRSAPYDYTRSNGLYVVEDLLKTIDDNDKEFAFNAMVGYLDSVLQNIDEFLNMDIEKSAFLTMSDSAIDSVLQSFSLIGTCLFLISNVYVNPSSLTPVRITQILRYFEEKGYSLVDNLAKLFQRCALEEVYMRSVLPNSVAQETTQPQVMNMPPINVHCMEPLKELPKDNKTSAKFKNTLQIRYFTSRFQTGIAVLFQCFLRMSTARKTTGSRNQEVALFERVVDHIISFMDTKYLESHLSYFLVLLNFNSFIFSFKGGVSQAGSFLQTIPLVLLYQKGGYDIYCKVIQFLLAKLDTFENLEEITKYKYVKEQTEVLTVSALMNALVFLDRSVQTDCIENIRYLSEYYPLNVEVTASISRSFVVKSKHRVLTMLLEYFHSETNGKLPDVIFKSILSLLKDIYYTENEDDDPLYQIRSELLPVSRMKLKLLVDSGFTDDQAFNFLAATADEIPTEEDVMPPNFTPEQWEKYLQLLPNADLDVQEIEPDVGGDELMEIRQISMSAITEKILTLLPNHPKLVNAVSQFFFSIFTFDAEFFYENVFDPLLDNMTEDASTMHLFGIFLNESDIYKQCSSGIGKFLDFLKTSFKPEAVNFSWFSKALYAYECILAKSEIPVSVNLEHEIEVGIADAVESYRIDADVKRSILEALLKVGDISEFYSALAISRILLLYARDTENAIEIYHSGILGKILKVIGLNQKFEKINYLQSSFLLLARRCFENTDIVTKLMDYELGKMNSINDLSSLIKSNPALVMRNADVYVELVCKKFRFTDFTEGGHLNSLALTSKAADSEDIQMSDVPKDFQVHRSGIIHLLVTQLMATYKKDWISEPAESETAEQKKKIKVTANPVCAYMVFLLKVIVELVTSYTQCKYEFVTYSKKTVFSDHAKPRATAINFFLYQLLDSAYDDAATDHEVERRNAISKLAKETIAGLLSTPQSNLDSTKIDPKHVDPDMSFLRRFTLEAITKVIKEKRGDNLEKLVELFDLLCHMLQPKSSELDNVRSFNYLKQDKYQLTKTMFELNIPSTVTGVVADMDFNYPWAKRVMKASVKTLHKLSSIRTDYSDLFKTEEEEEESDDENSDEDEDSKDIFKNSALAMYDVDDIDEDDMDSGYEDVEEVAFVDDNDEPVEVVFTEDEGAGFSENDLMDEDDSDDSGIEIIGADEGEIVDTSDEGEYSDNSDSYTDGSGIEIDIDSDGIEIEVESVDGEDLDPESMFSDAEGWESGSDDESGDDSDEDSDDDSDDDDDDEDDQPDSDDDGYGSIEFVEELLNASSGGPSGDRRRGHHHHHGELDDDSDYSSDREERTFQGVSHVFPGAGDVLDARSIRRSNSIGRFFSVQAGGGRVNSNTLANPLAPSALEEVESSIYESSIGGANNSRARRIGDLLNFRQENTVGIPLKSTLARWKDIHDMFYDSQHYWFNIIPTVINCILQESFRLFEIKKNEMEEKRRLEMEKKKEAQEKKKEEEEKRRASVTAARIEPREPVYVRIGDQDVDIAGTDFDAEFLNALPEGMREEVFTQHVIERRSANEGSHEIDSDFLDALPDAIREEIIMQEEAQGHHHSWEETEEVDIDEPEDSESKEEDIKPESKKNVRFPPLLDRNGVASIVRSVFLPQSYLAREDYHDLFNDLCLSKQNRIEIVNMFLLILNEGINDHQSMEKVFCHITSRASSTKKKLSNTMPSDATPLILANQTIEVLQHLLEHDNHLRHFFLTEHENSKKWPSKYPIHILFSLLKKKVITDEAVLMDLLTRILEVVTKSLTKSKKKFDVPPLSDDQLKDIVNIFSLDSCTTKVFQQTLTFLGNIKVTKIQTFTDELCRVAKHLKESLIVDLNAFSTSIDKFSSQTSDQSKMLKVLTALDYLYNPAELSHMYMSLQMGPLWSALSDCLTSLEENSSLILLPMIESLLVVCKHAQTRQERRYVSPDFNDDRNLFFTFTDQHKKLLNQMVRISPKLMVGPFSMLVKNPKILEFDNKRSYFYGKLQVPKERPTLAVNVRRDQVFLDSYRALFFKSNKDLKDSKLEITFNGEAGVDAGGVTREWYQVLSRQMFNPDYALFLPVDKTTFHPNRTSGVNPEHLSFFKFIGRIIGKAIHDSFMLDCHFSRDVYKNILGRAVSLKDMESLDVDYYKSLMWMLENDITDIITEDFSVETDDYGEHKIVDLIPNGRNIDVTEENKHEYVQMVVQYKLTESVKEQMSNFLQGFYEMIPKDLISIFDEQELELLISGLPDIDVDDWKNNTNYVNYSSTDKQISYFWRAVRSFDVEERAKLLQFVTGTSKVPLNGFKELTGVNGIAKFSIHKDYGAIDRLPSSHTCFNQLDLPAYDSYEALRGSLLLAINEGHEGFGIA